MQLNITCEPNNGATYDDQLAAATAAERLGFTGFFRSDHYVRIDGKLGLPGPTDAWVTLGALARETTRLRLGTLLTPVTLRQPGPLAIQVAQIDHMSGGRIELGLGAGWFEREHSAYGFSFPPTPSRFDMLEEQLQVITGLWTAPVETGFSHRGEHYTLESAPGLPKPVQQPHPPIIMGGAGGKRSLSLAARFADEYNVVWKGTETVLDIFQRLSEAVENEQPDRKVRFSIAQIVLLAKDSAALARKAEEYGLDLATVMERGAFCGTAEDVLEQLQPLREAGIERVYIPLLDFKRLDQIEEISELILPHLG